MSGIFGIFHRNGSPLTPADLENMSRTLAYSNNHSCHSWQDGIVGLGVATLTVTSGALHSMPRHHKASGIAFAAFGRLDNRADLARILKISQQQTSLSDGEWMLEAYLRWGPRTPEHLFGDWSFAAWHVVERKLFLARDHFGNTSLFYYAGPNIFAFAPTRQTLFSLNLCPLELDELYMAQVLVSWPACQGEHTIHRSIGRLPPAHSLTLTPDQVETRQYWHMEDVRELRLSRQDCLEEFKARFEASVACRLPAPGKTSGVAVTLSGGLDSSSVTAAAAGLLEMSNQRVGAFVSVPLTNPDPYTGNRFGDEYPFAAATAQFLGNVDLYPVLAEGICPIEAIRRQLEILGEPAVSAGNAYWFFEIERSARALGYRVLLTGQSGNAGISWTGDPLSQSLPAQFRQLHLGGMLASHLGALKGRLSCLCFLKSFRIRRAEQNEWYRHSAIRAEFAHRLNLLERRLSDPNELPARSPREKRFRILRPGRSNLGALHAEIGAAHGIEVRDPTADVRVLEFVLSVPDQFFTDPITGSNRWLIREAMKGRLPDEVRLNRRRGRQAADLVTRLRASATAVEFALTQLAAGAAADFVDVPFMRATWEAVKVKDTPETLHHAITILTRGIGVGLFVNQFSSRSALRSKAAAAYRNAQLEAVR